MNTAPLMADEPVPTDAVLQWAVLIAKAAALGVLDLSSEAELHIPRTGFRTRPGSTDEDAR